MNTIVQMYMATLLKYNIYIDNRYTQRYTIIINVLRYVTFNTNILLVSVVGWDF